MLSGAIVRGGVVMAMLILTLIDTIILMLITKSIPIIEILTGTTSPIIAAVVLLVTRQIFRKLIVTALE